MKLRRKPRHILMAEDDPDDRLIALDALQEASLPDEVAFVGDGEELLAYLRCEKQYAHRPRRLTPDLIMLDLNMPRMDGREVLQILKSDQKLSRIPIIIFSTSESPEDVRITYNLGVSSFITKPSSFEGLVEVMRSLGRYWFELVSLPHNED